MNQRINGWYRSKEYLYCYKFSFDDNWIIHAMTDIAYDIEKSLIDLYFPLPTIYENKDKFYSQLMQNQDSAIIGNIIGNNIRYLNPHVFTWRDSPLGDFLPFRLVAPTPIENSWMELL